MAKQKNNSLDFDKTADLAFQELLELATMDLTKANNIKKNSLIEKQNNDSLTIDKNDLSSIIKFAKQKGNKIKVNNSWNDPNKKAEQEIIIKAKQKGKSEYDSDVLRELILQRQKNKRKDKITSPIDKYLKNIKNNKE